MEKLLHPAESRGSSDLGWLKARHSFSFANYFNPKRMKFGLLRVLNDDTIAPGKGYDKHPHEDMEIVTIPLQGSLEHEDTLGNKGIVEAGGVQVISAGKGLERSERNASDKEALNLLQIWVFANNRTVEPRYDQRNFSEADKKNKLLRVVGPKTSPDGDALWIHQRTYFNLGNLDAGKSVTYRLNHQGHGMYIFLISGKVKVASEELSERDAIGLWNTDSTTIEALEKSEILLIEVPLN